jgi:hypothetical protein
MAAALASCVPNERRYGKTKTKARPRPSYRKSINVNTNTCLQHRLRHIQTKGNIMKFTILAIASIMTVTACVETADVPDPITQAVTGRTLIAGDTRIIAGTNGTLVGTLAGGDTLSGKWRMSGGKWCRTLTQPARFSGPEVCQDAALTDGQLVIIGSNGKPTVYTIE